MQYSVGANNPEGSGAVQHCHRRMLPEQLLGDIVRTGNNGLPLMMARGMCELFRYIANCFYVLEMENTSVFQMVGCGLCASRSPFPGDARPREDIQTIQDAKVVSPPRS